MNTWIELLIPTETAEKIKAISGVFLTFKLRLNLT